MSWIRHFSCMGVLLSAALPVHAAEPPGPVVASRGEDWLGEGSDLGLELAHVVAAGKKGLTGQARRDLELIAAEAEARGLPEIWIRAQQAWVRFTLAEQPESDLTPAVEELLRKARGWGMTSEETEIFALWSEVLEGQGQWLMALKAQDRSIQQALDSGRVTRAIEGFLEMSRLCRPSPHPWRLQQVWERLEQVLAQRPAVLPDDLVARIDAERNAAAAVGGIPAIVSSGGTPGIVDLQPRDSRILVSSPEREVGRSRFLLTNRTPHPVDGTLTLRTGGAAISAWRESGNNQWIALGKLGLVAPDRALHLRPGQQMEIFLEHDPSPQEERVSLVWKTSGGAPDSKPVQSDVTFYFGEALPATSIVNAGIFESQGRGNIPIYHEIYHRGRRPALQNLHVSSSIPCRLEIYDHDTGRLLAIDAEGDGVYSGPGDQLLDDADRDGFPDLVVGERARALEIQTWPASSSQASFTVRAGIKTKPDFASSSSAADSGSSPTQVENIVRPMRVPAGS